MDGRISHLDYFMIIAQAASLRGSCPRRQVGAVLTKDNRIISTGYNGSPPGMPHCVEVGCVQPDGKNCVATIHAETNCVIRAREVGDSLYCTDQPCLNCLKTLIGHNPNIKIYYLRDYSDPARDEFVAHFAQYSKFKMIKVEIDSNKLQSIQFAVQYHERL